MTIKNLLVLALAGIVILGGCSKENKEKSSAQATEKKTETSENAAPAQTASPAPDNTVSPAAEQKAAEAGDAFDKVKPGMSIDEATAIMGAPKAQFATGEMTQYHWEKGPAQFVVQFKDGKVFQKIYSSDRSGSPATGISKNFGKIRVGMTREEAIKILGRPAQESSALDGSNNAGTQHWEDGKASLTVLYQNGKVIMATVDNGDSN